MWPGIKTHDETMKRLGEVIINYENIAKAANNYNVLYGDFVAIFGIGVAMFSVGVAVFGIPYGYSVYLKHVKLYRKPYQNKGG